VLTVNHDDKGALFSLLSVYSFSFQVLIVTLLSTTVHLQQPAGDVTVYLQYKKYSDAKKRTRHTLLLHMQCLALYAVRKRGAEERKRKASVISFTVPYPRIPADKMTHKGDIPSPLKIGEKVLGNTWSMVDLH
jgi:hypothetical protein